MKVLAVLYLAFAVVYAKSDVIDLTDATFEKEVVKHKLLLVEFFAPWCGHCKKLAPEYEKAATILKQNDPPVSIAKMDCTENAETCTKHGVSGYPTLKIFRGLEKVEDYNGGRTADTIVSTIAKQSGPSAVILKDLSDYNKFLEKDTPVVIGFYESGNTELKDFESECDTMREDYKFAVTSSEEIMEEADAKNVIKLFRPKILSSKFEEQELIFDGKPSGLKSFLKKNWFGKCYIATPQNFDKFEKPLVVVLPKTLDYKLNVKGSNYFRNRVMKWGGEFMDKVHFGIGNFVELRSLAPEGLADDRTVSVFIIDGNDRKYSMSDEFKQDTFIAFIKAFLAGEITPFIKSEPVPENNDGGVTVVVGKNFDEIVMDESKDVLIEFYAPWCGHCKSLAPKWDELGEEMAGDDSVVIAKMDSTANDSPKQFAVSGFPTIYWAPKNDKSNPRKYQGGREVKEFLKFIKDNKTPDNKSEL